MSNETRSTSKTLLACVAAWFVPGTGHIILRKWGRGLILGFSVLLMFILGLRMDGRLFSFDSDFFSLLKFIADASVGIVYFIARGQGWGVGRELVRSGTHDYGNVFLYVAGLLNMLIILDVYDIGTGRKP